MIARVRARLRLGMVSRLMLGFYLVTLLTIALILLIIGTLMRERLLSNADRALQRDADTVEAFLQSGERFLSEEVTAVASLEGMSAAVTSGNRAQLERLLGPIQRSHELDALYVLDRNLNVLCLLGEPMSDNAGLARLAALSAGAEKSVSTLLDLDGVLWLGALAPHRAAGGEIDATILLGKHFDRAALAPLHPLVQSAFVVVLGGSLSPTFAQPPADLTLARLRDAFGPPAAARAGTTAFQSGSLDGTLYRVAAQPLPPRAGGQPVVYLFEPTANIDQTVQFAVRQVLITGIVIMLLGSALVYLYGRGITRPLRRLTHAARALAGGDLDHTIQVQSSDEIGELADGFEQMRMRVRAMLGGQQRWNAELEERVREKTTELRVLNDTRNRLLHQIITAQEDERRRIARELHDDTSQALTAIIARLAALCVAPPDDICGDLKDLRAAAARTLQEVNRIVLDLRPSLLDEFGLDAALSWYADRRLGGGVCVTQTTFGQPVNLPANVKTVLFRVGQEALSNIARHADASHVQINLVYTNGETSPALTLQISDDGKGFNPEPAQSAGAHDDRPHFGLLGMQERISLVGGQLDIQSTPGHGTCISAMVPLQACDELPVIADGQAGERAA